MVFVKRLTMQYMLQMGPQNDGRINRWSLFGGLHYLKFEWNYIFVTSFKHYNYKPHWKCAAWSLQNAESESFLNCERWKRESSDRGCVILHPKLARLIWLHQNPSLRKLSPRFRRSNWNSQLFRVHAKTFGWKFKKKIYIFLRILISLITTQN